MNPHLPGTDGAITVATTDHERCEVLIAHATSFAGVFVVTSEVPGVGKTLSVAHGAHATGADVHILNFVPGTSPAVANATILASLGMRVESNASLHETTAELRDLLADRPRIVLVDSAQDLDQTLLAHLRVLHETTRFTLGLVGHARLLAKAAVQPELFDGVDRWVRFAPLEPEAMVGALQRYHPLFTTCAPDELANINQRHAKGRWRRWAMFLRTARLYAKGAGLTRKTIASTLIALDWQRLERT